ncbi:MAG TPA: reverse transcriptase domain-containing protein, partial [Chitinophagaceae bacterium]|nr:reverse transcriptase domain-containing protein [Chitinophagaceae bacterium]
MEWLKIKGYYHFSSQVSNDWRRQKLLIQHVQNKNYIAKYAFFPLLHTNIKERRYKKHPSKLNKKGKAIRVHSYYDEDKKKFVKTTKIRPLHYANHKDAVIYSYYAFILNKYYENYLKTFPQLNASITAYRKIPVLNSTLADEKIKNKGSLHFAAEVFKEIKERAKYKDKVAVIALDIKSFFSSLDHVYLKKLWEYILGVPNLPSDHFNVFKSVTNFSFVYKNDLRKFKTRKGRKANFNEKKIAEIRNKKGINAFFKNPKDFREAIKNKEIFVYKNNFKNKKGEMIGIPQGLPISAVLANLYLLEFDKVIVNELVKKHNCFYRRYSDDIILIGEEMDLNKIEDFVIKEMKKVKVEISKEKTEKFIFKKANGRLTSF